MMEQPLCATIDGDGMLSLEGLAKFLTALNGTLKAVERSVTGKRRTTVAWKIVEMSYTTEDGKYHVRLKVLGEG
jgi:hypothetical protein